MPRTDLAIFLDFDGTVTFRDATDAILEAFADPRWTQVEDAWKEGGIGSRECLAAQMALVTARQDQVDALLDSIEIDPGLSTLLDLCATRALPVHIVSDGFDYCIERILKRPSLGLASHLDRMTIVCSHMHSDGDAWRVGFPSPPSVCVHGCATCKPAAMARLRPEESTTIFVGDGLSDRHAALAADIVFAKDHLAIYCRERSVPFRLFDDLSGVASDVERMITSEAVARDLVAGNGYSSV